MHSSAPEFRSLCGPVWPESTLAHFRPIRASSDHILPIPGRSWPRSAKVRLRCVSDWGSETMKFHRTATGACDQEAVAKRRVGLCLLATPSVSLTSLVNTSGLQRCPGASGPTTSSVASRDEDCTESRRNVPKVGSISVVEDRGHWQCLEKGARH